MQNENELTKLINRVKKQTSSSNKKQLKPAVIVLIDFVCVGIILVVFSLFHHVIPRPSDPIQSTIPHYYTATPAKASDSADISLSDSSNESRNNANTIGDFSERFNAVELDKSGLYSYENNTVKISIKKSSSYGAVYFIADVWVKSIDDFKTAFAKDTFGVGVTQKPVDIADSVGAIFAVTGDYCGARSEGLVIRNGQLYRESINSDICVLYVDGTMETIEYENTSSWSYADKGVCQAWGFGPALLSDGQAIKSFKDKIRVKNPRSSIGYYEPGHYCFITVDGRQRGYSDGLSLSELSEVYADLGCKYAFNLDGGATAAMVFNGKVINRPYKGGRASSDIICFLGD